jgi:hypothetical protein
MTNLFIKYDIETETVIAGPQGSRPDDSWVPFLPAKDLKPRQKSSTKWAAEAGVVVQVPGDEHAPDYSEQRRNAYPKLAEQLDKLFHDIDNGTLDKTGSFYQIIKGVKDDIPKSGG